MNKRYYNLHWFDAWRCVRDIPNEYFITHCTMWFARYAALVEHGIVSGRIYISRTYVSFFHSHGIKATIEYMKPTKGFNVIIYDEDDTES